MPSTVPLTAFKIYSIFFLFILYNTLNIIKIAIAYLLLMFIKMNYIYVCNYITIIIHNILVCVTLAGLTVGIATKLAGLAGGGGGVVPTPLGEPRV